MRFSWRHKVVKVNCLQFNSYTGRVEETGNTLLVPSVAIKLSLMFCVAQHHHQPAAHIFFATPGAFFHVHICNILLNRMTMICVGGTFATLLPLSRLSSSACFRAAMLFPGYCSFTKCTYSENYIHSRAHSRDLLTNAWKFKYTIISTTPYRNLSGKYKI